MLLKKDKSFEKPCKSLKKPFLRPFAIIYVKNHYLDFTQISHIPFHKIHFNNGCLKLRR